MEIGVLKKVDGGRCKINGEVFEGYNVVSIGWLSGITEEMRANPSAFALKPLEVTAMELYWDGTTVTLRHGRIKQWRDDLTIHDCTWEKI